MREGRKLLPPSADIRNSNRVPSVIRKLTEAPSEYNAPPATVAKKRPRGG